MFTRKFAFRSAFLCLLLAAATAKSQTVPTGSCMIVTGEWCWPSAPLSYGDPCDCQMPDGTFMPGVVQ